MHFESQCLFVKQGERFGSAANLNANLKESTCDAGVMGSIPGLGTSPEGRNGNPLKYSCLENLMDRGAWQATVHRVAKESNRTY